MGPALLALLPSLFKIGENVLDKVIPDPEQAEKAKAEFIKQARELDASEISNFRDFVVAYEGAGDKVHPIIQILRGSVRPILTYFLAGTFVYGFANPTAISPEAMTMLFQLNLLSLGFWFGERALRNLGLDISTMGKSKKTE